MSLKRKATSDEGDVHPTKKRNTDYKVDKASKPQKVEVVENKIVSHQKTSSVSKIKQRSDEGVQPTKKRNTDCKVDKTSKPQKAEVEENKVVSHQKTSSVSKIMQKKNRNSSVKVTHQNNNKTGQTTGKATVTVEETSTNTLSKHLPRKPEEVSCNWKQLLKVC